MIKGCWNCSCRINFICYHGNHTDLGVIGLRYDLINNIGGKTVIDDNGKSIVIGSGCRYHKKMTFIFR